MKFVIILIKALWRMAVEGRIKKTEVHYVI